MASLSGEDSGQRILAAVDLGSNSFHLQVARANGRQLEIIDRLKEPVRLAAGLGDDQRLDADVRERALACLARFGQRLNRLPGVQLRAVGTSALRRARPADQFLSAAEQALGHPIDVVYGVEEARLIYAGVSLDLDDRQPRRLVIDIGGGSTEIVLGHGATPRLLHSLSLGAVTWSLRYFPGGQVSRTAWHAAVVEARLALAPIARAYRAAGWQRAIGASGSIKAIRRVCRDAGWSDGDITSAALDELAQTLIESGGVDDAGFESLSDSRRPIFAGAAAILTALFDSLGIEAMGVSDKALREGILLELLGHEPDHDPRHGSVASTQQRYNVNTAQAERVCNTARALQADLGHWLPPRTGGSIDALHWAGQLHEIGMAIAHKGYHRHGAYIVRNADLHGFSRTEQTTLAALLCLHRGKFRRTALDDIPEAHRQGVERLALVLRLAVLLNRDRDPERSVPVRLSADGQTLQLHFPAGWLDTQPLTQADLAREQKRVSDAGYTLTITVGSIP